MHRIRFAMAEDHGSAPKLSGTVEVDEAWVGGKPRHRMRSRINPVTGMLHQYLTAVETGEKKTPIMALVQRGGKVRVRQIERVNRETLGSAIHELVEHGSTIYTDENASYNHLDRSTRYKHESVCHSAKEYARGDVSTNTVEGFFSLIKRGVYGTFHSVSKHHLHRYLAEFEFRYNTREMGDGERTVAAIQNSEGKRLLYAGPSEAA
jgi:transposase-like protein